MSGSLKLCTKLGVWGTVGGAVGGVVGAELLLLRVRLVHLLRISLLGDIPSKVFLLGGYLVLLWEELGTTEE